jgi:hypothetical protein
MGDLDVAANLYVKRLSDSEAYWGNITVPSPQNRGKLAIMRQLGSDQCYRTSPVEEGAHILTLQQKTTVQINIAYILFW